MAVGMPVVGGASSTERAGSIKESCAPKVERAPRKALVGGQLFNIRGAVHSESSVIHILETVKVKQMPRSVLSVCTVSQVENRKDSACRMVELSTTSGVGNSKATEAVSRLSWGGCSMRRTWGTRRSIFPAASRRAVNRDMAVGSIIFTANTPSSVNNSTPDYRRCSRKCRVKKK